MKEIIIYIYKRNKRKQIKKINSVENNNNIIFNNKKKLE